VAESRRLALESLLHIFGFAHLDARHAGNSC
jgi:hypothetical protein